MNRDIFEDLFVLEIANNHWGTVERGLKIIDAYSKVVRFNNVRAALKLPVSYTHLTLPTNREV